jgi:putative glycosyltransferase (TIGR04348 family)
MRSLAIRIVTPAPRGSRAGNRATAVRWARLLRELGHRVVIAERYDGEPSDVLIALHARKSAAATLRSKREHPDRPVVLALTGTDLYHDLRSSRAAKRSLELADRIVVLQPHGLRELAPAVRRKTRVIVQSAQAPRRRAASDARHFDVCMLGHLRPVKDPFRAALAARRLSADSRIRVLHCGKALSPSMERRARSEMRRNPRYVWRGEVSPAAARGVLARSRLVVITSKLEGGSNVLSEALACGVPVLSSRIGGSTGLLGERYPGLFNVGDTRALSRLMSRCERDASFRAELERQCAKLQPLVRPERERAAWKRLLAELTAR